MFIDYVIALVAFYQKSIYFWKGINEANLKKKKPLTKKIFMNSDFFFKV